MFECLVTRVWNYLRESQGLGGVSTGVGFEVSDVRARESSLSGSGYSSLLLLQYLSACTPEPFPP